MTEESFNLEPQDQLRAENDFLKMKLMLERGGFFGGVENSELPPEIENQFLSNIVAFEEQFEHCSRIKVFDKIGRPQHFKRVNEINDDDIDAAWRQLLEHMNSHGVDLGVCSPNVTTRELYRFATEELFEHETDDMNLPGWSTNFIYDEFYPDPVYDNTRSAVDDCIKCILRKEYIEWTHFFSDDDLRLNDKFPLSVSELQGIVNRFKDAYDDLEIVELVSENCTVDGVHSVVTGFYSLDATAGHETIPLKGTWKVTFLYDEALEFWRITEVFIEGIHF